MKLIDRRELFGKGMAALVEQRHDKDLAVAHVIEDAPGIAWDCAKSVIVDFGDLAAAEG